MIERSQIRPHSANARVKSNTREPLQYTKNQTGTSRFFTNPKFHPKKNAIAAVHISKASLAAVEKKKTQKAKALSDWSRGEHPKSLTKTLALEKTAEIQAQQPFQKRQQQTFQPISATCEPVLTENHRRSRSRLTRSRRVPKKTHKKAEQVGRFVHRRHPI